MPTSKNADSPKKRHPRTGNPGRGMLYVMLALALVLVVFLIAIFPYVNSGADHDAMIKIPHGASASNVKDSLSKHLGDEYASKVMNLVKLRRTDMSKRNGAYLIKEGTNPLEAMRKLTSGAQTPVKITVNGYRSLPDLLKNVGDKFEFSNDSLYSALYDNAFLKKYGLDMEDAMALFVNDTYEAYWSSSPRQVLEKFGDNYNRLWNDENKAKAAKLGLKPVQVMILASIVDEETNDVDEKGVVGRLYVNRLQKGMRLQADPTVRFALGDFTIKRVTGRDLQIQSPYNTYLHDGLPPGPIRTVGKQTVNDILDSKPHEYLYMCASEDFSGKHNFAATFAEHTRNALRYRNALDHRGITR